MRRPLTTVALTAGLLALTPAAASASEIPPPCTTYYSTSTSYPFAGTDCHVGDVYAGTGTGLPTYTLFPSGGVGACYDDLCANALYFGYVSLKNGAAVIVGTDNPSFNYVFVTRNGTQVCAGGYVTGVGSIDDCV